MKTLTKSESVKSLQTIPNIGPSLAQDLYDLGYREPKDLKKQDPLKMYRKDRKSTRLNSSHLKLSRMPSSA